MVRPGIWVENIPNFNDKFIDALATKFMSDCKACFAASTDKLYTGVFYYRFKSPLSQGMLTKIHVTL